MADNWKSDWEKLFAKCAADEDYRQQLTAALAGDDDQAVKTLLANIGADGPNAQEQDRRVQALKAAQPSMENVRAEFEGAGPVAAAP